MVRLTLSLNLEEWGALIDSAEAERRSSADQAIVLIRRSLGMERVCGICKVFVADDSPNDKVKKK